MKLFAAIVASVLTASVAHADNCARSRDHILSSPADLPYPAQSYQALFKTCIETLLLPNVKDAYLLKDGAVGVVARNDSITLTAVTLSQFCRRFPRATMRFISKGDLLRANTITRLVQLSAKGATPCSKIVGSG